jgi:hypothetical protein
MWALAAGVCLAPPSADFDLIVSFLPEHGIIASLTPDDRDWSIADRLEE